MDDPLMSPEELICSMQADEICELLDELGISLTTDQASDLQTLISKLGSVDIALNQLVQSEDRDSAAA